MANEPESQAGFQPGSGPNNLTWQSPQPSPPKTIFAAPQPATPPAVIEQFPLYDPAAPATLQSVKPNQAGYTLAEYSRDVPAPPPKPSPIHRRGLIVGIVAAVLGVILTFGVLIFDLWDDPEVYGPGWEDPIIYEAPAGPGEANGEAYPGWLEPGQDYGHQDWRYSNMSNLDLTASSFVGSDLRNVTLSYSTLTATDFTDADLRAASLDSVVANGATFVSADLRGAILSGGSFQGTNLKGADMRGANLVGADFSGANLTTVDFAGATYDDGTVWPVGFSAPANAVKI